LLRLGRHRQPPVAAATLGHVERLVGPLEELLRANSASEPRAPHPGVAAPTLAVTLRVVLPAV